jgi:TatD DNase family protein
MWFDTHIHLDCVQYAGQQADLITQARQAGVNQWVIPTTSPQNFTDVRQLAHQTAGAYYALGIHPLLMTDWTQARETHALETLAVALNTHQHDPKLVAVGEIGLDYFVPHLDYDQQLRVLKAQLTLAKQYNLPVLLHVRKAHDVVTQSLRKISVRGGIAHAFNGSAVQAQAFIQLGFCLGFGGAATYPRALRIRELLATVPAHHLVLETDGPDMAPIDFAKQINPPKALATIGMTLAQVRGLPVDDFARLCTTNSHRILNLKNIKI